ncbi:hypothetical protein NK8_71330 (plasmid) [Caballeronia sp. NK8]|uniref:hypothetical protein n=1 Tax=Caballeronia sp. NK8 TaxID=140098 RepID=UPI001BB5B753|nr:hypothetical protein [Caballeronia sp. NK8]BCQ28943.1 hypothetical protein NK8_71330 [Caballeronia sp. NK8]
MKRVLEAALSLAQSRFGGGADPDNGCATREFGLALIERLAFVFRFRIFKTRSEANAAVRHSMSIRLPR